jgi:hypothetical protein
VFGLSQIGKMLAVGGPVLGHQTIRSMNFAPRVWPAVLMPATATSTSPTAPSRATASEPGHSSATGL